MKADKAKPKPTPTPELKRGDLVLVTWLDIVSSGGGDPAKADLHEWEQPGYYYGIGERSGIAVMVLSLSAAPRDRAFDEQSGYICIPLACVRKVQRSTHGRTVPTPEAD